MGEDTEGVSHGCLMTICQVLAGFGIYAVIEQFAGRPAALWFVGGFVVAAILAFWEVSRPGSTAFRKVGE
jgi:hypothetical protein